MLLQPCLNFMADAVHYHLFCSTDKLAILRNELLKYRPFRNLLFRSTSRVRQRGRRFCTGSQCSLVVDLCPEFQEELRGGMSGAMPVAYEGRAYQFLSPGLHCGCHVFGTHEGLAQTLGTFHATCQSSRITYSADVGAQSSRNCTHKGG